ncbi:MAG: aminoglycoside phosphotransferase [Actinomycetia bacterium]|nr:aminoglycoside phosphotransferase [Actinomycetes bacterium]
MVAVPRLTPEQAEEIALRHYGVNGSAERLAAEHDDTFRLTTRAGHARLLKISVAGTAPGPVSLQTAILLHLASAAPRLPVQRVTAALNGAPEVRIPGGEGPARLVTMTTWLDGELLGRAAVSPALRRETGAALARLNVALRGLRHPGARRTHLWDLQSFWRLRALLDDLPGSGLLPEVSRALPAGTAIPAGGLRAALTDSLDRFDSHVRPRLAQAPVQVIHTDFHGENLLTDGRRITGILDFGDALTGPVAMDVGVAACYQLGTAPDVLAPATDLVTGYHAVAPLGPADLALAAEFTVARVAARIIVSQWNALREPANRRYLLRRTPQAIEHLTALRLLTPDEIARTLRAACGTSRGM